MAATTTTTVPWYDLIPDVPEPPEDGMQQNDTTIHLNAILMARYANDPDVLVAGPATNVIYNSEVPGSVIVPDCYVVFGVSDERMIKRDRRSYRIDEWDAVPAFVAEVASPSTASRDLNEKREIYAQMGVQEYWRFDITGGEYYGEPLVGERLVDGEYQRIDQHDEPNGSIWSRSEVLGVDFWCIPDFDGYPEFRLKDAVSGEWLNSLRDEVEARRQEQEARLAELRLTERRLAAEREARQAAEANAEREREVRQAAEERAAELEAELRRLRGE